MNQQMSTLHVAENTALTIRIWKPEDSDPKGIIIISHGYGEHSGRYGHVAEYFTQQGYVLYAPDHRGHGHSHGGKLGYIENIGTLAEDLNQLINFARSEYQFVPLFLLGHSMGALVALYFTLHHQSTIKALIITDVFTTGSHEYPATVRKAVALIAKIMPRLEVGPAVGSDTLSRDASVSKAYDSDPHVYHGKVPARTGVALVDAGDYVRANLTKITLPIMILHGGEDKLAKPEWSQYVYDHVSSSDKTIKIYENLRHEILNEPEKSRVMADIWVWLAAHG